MKSRKNFTLILSVFFILLLIISLYVCSINNFAKSNNVNEMINKLESKTYILEVYIIQGLFKDPDPDLEFSDVVDIEKLNKIFSNIINDSFQYLINKNNHPQIKNVDFLGIFNETYLNRRLKSKEAEASFNNRLTKLIASYNLQLKKEIDEIRDYSPISFKSALSPITKLFVITSLLALGIVISFCQRSWQRILGWVGSSIFMASLIVIAICHFLGNWLQTNLLGGSLINVIFVNNIFDNWMQCGIFTLIIGVVLMLIYFIVYFNRTRS